MSIFNSVSGYISSRTRSRRRYCASSHETAVTWALDTDLNMIPVVRHQPLPLHTTGTLLLSHYLCLYRRNDGMACLVSSVLVDSLSMSDGRCVSLVCCLFTSLLCSLTFTRQLSLFGCSWCDTAQVGHIYRLGSVRQPPQSGQYNFMIR